MTSGHEYLSLMKITIAINKGSGTTLEFDRVLVGENCSLLLGTAASDKGLNVSDGSERVLILGLVKGSTNRGL